MKFRKITLTKEEKEAGRGSLVQFMKENPVRNAGDVRLGISKGSLSPITYRLYSLTIKPMRNIFTKPLALLISLLVVGGGGTVFAAQISEPGDLLYPVKVHFNEPVQEFLAMNPEAKADFAINRVENRLSEASDLADKGKLTPELQAELKTLIEDHMKDINAYLDKVKQESGDEKLVGLNKKLENLLGNYDKKLAKVESDTVEQSGKKEKVKELLTDAESQAQDHGALKNQSAAEGKMTAAQNKLDEVAKFLVDNKDKLNVDAYNSAVAAYDEAKKVFTDASQALTDGKYSDAFDMFKDVMDKAVSAKQEAKAGGGQNGQKEQNGDKNKDTSEKVKKDNPADENAGQEDPQDDSQGGQGDSQDSNVEQEDGQGDQGSQGDQGGQDDQVSQGDHGEQSDSQDTNIEQEDSQEDQGDSHETTEPQDGNEASDTGVED